jgi:hypothetical protein
MSDQTRNDTTEAKDPSGSGFGGLNGSEFSTDGFLSDETAQAVWCKLCDRISDNTNRMEPLSRTERELYETLTAWLTLRAKAVYAVVTDISPNTSMTCRSPQGGG